MKKQSLLRVCSPTLNYISIERSTMLFHFRLDPLDQVNPWGEGTGSLHWYGLTQGQYWLQAGDVELLRYSDLIYETMGGDRHCDYYVVFLYDYLMEMLPHIMEPVPESLQPYLFPTNSSAWQQTREQWFVHHESRYGEEKTWEIFGLSNDWLIPRSLDTNFLSTTADINIWSDTESVIIAWDNTGKEIQGIPAWSAIQGEYRLPRDLFAEEVRSFHKRMMDAMQERITNVIDGGLAEAITVDIDALVYEQEMRSRPIERSLAGSIIPTEWEQIREAISIIEYDEIRHSENSR